MSDHVYVKRRLNSSGVYFLDELVSNIVWHQLFITTETNISLAINSRKLDSFVLVLCVYYEFWRLPRWLSDKESAFQAGDVDLIPGLGIPG